MKLEGAAHGADVLDFGFHFQARGFCLDGVTPPFIRVEFTGCRGPKQAFTLTFRRFRIEVLDRPPLREG